MCDKKDMVIEETKEGVGKNQFWTTMVSVALFLAGIGITAYLNLETRVRLNEINIEALKVEYHSDKEVMQKNIQEMIVDMKDIRETVHNIDKRVSVDEARWQQINKKKED